MPASTGRNQARTCPWRALRRGFGRTPLTSFSTSVGGKSASSVAFGSMIGQSANGADGKVHWRALSTHQAIIGRSASDRLPPISLMTFSRKCHEFKSGSRCQYWFSGHHRPGVETPVQRSPTPHASTQSPGSKFPHAQTKAALNIMLIVSSVPPKRHGLKRQSLTVSSRPRSRKRRCRLRRCSCCAMGSR